MSWWLFIGFLAGLWLSPEAAQRENTNMCEYPRSFCYNTNSNKTCFSPTTFHLRGSHQVTTRLASPRCKITSSSSVVIIKDIQSQINVEILTATRVFANGTIIMDPQMLAANVSFEWPLFNDHHAVLKDSTPVKPNGGDEEGGISEIEDVDPNDGQSRTLCVGHVKSPHRYTCQYTGTHRNSRESHYPDSSYKLCVCKINDNVGREEYGGKWRCCNCDHTWAIVCHKEMTGDTVSTSSITPDVPSRVSDDHTTAIASESSSKLTGEITHILLIPLVLLVVAFIIIAVISIIRKRKFSGRSEVSSGYETTVRENHYELSGEGVPIYTELQLTQEPAPSNSTVYSSVQPTDEAVDMGSPVVYAELDNVAVIVSPVYSQPFEAEASGSNTEYAEPFKPDTKSTATAPVANLYDNIAAVDQQSGVYSLAKAIPLSEPNVIYSQPNKPGK